MNKEEYDEYYKEKLIEGQEYQDKVVHELYLRGFPIVQYASKKMQYKNGESLNGYEIKKDTLFSTSGNLWIEVAEKSNPENRAYIASGIYRGDNSWLYIIGDNNEVFIFSIKDLRNLHTAYREVTNKTKTSIGYLLPVKIAKQKCIKHINFSISEKPTRYRYIEDVSNVTQLTLFDLDKEYFK